MPQQSMTILLVEDNPDDVVLFKDMISELQNDALRPMLLQMSHVGTLREARDYLDGDHRRDVILYDLTLPDSQDMNTIDQLSPYAAQIPAIVLTGLSDDALAIEALKRGSQDYLVKSEVTPVMLARSIHYAVERFKILKEREKLITDLHKAMDEIKILSGLIPICANCQRIRNDKGYWEQWQAYISTHSQAQFSHGICPQCAKSVYGMDLTERKPGKKDPATFQQSQP